MSVSFDPIIDTPPVLKKHAQTLGADLSRWTFLTGDRDDVDRFAARFGVLDRARADRPARHHTQPAHGDRRRRGKLVKVYTGNEWTPDQVLATSRHRWSAQTERRRAGTIEAPPRSALSRRASGGSIDAPAARHSTFSAI